MSTILTTDDLLAAARDNQEFREAFRREILGEELLELPQAFKRHDADFQALVSQVESLTTQVQALAKETVVLARSVNGMNDRLDAQGFHLATISNTLERIQRAQQSDSLLHRRLRGGYAIEATRRAAPDIAGRFGPALQVSSLLPTVLTANDLTELIKAHRQNIQRLNLSEAQWQSFISPDVIIRVEALFPKDPETAQFYLSVQSSYTVDDDDVRRAVEHAGILRALTGRRAYAVVSGTQLLERVRNQPTENAREVVGDDALATALWFQLPDSSIDPPEPC